MDDAGSVRRRQRICDLNGVFEHFADGQPFAPDAVVEGFALDKLHGDEVHGMSLRGGGIDTVYMNDVRVIQSRSGLGLLDKPPLSLGVRDRFGRQQLDWLPGGRGEYPRP